MNDSPLLALSSLNALPGRRLGFTSLEREDAPDGNFSRRWAKLHPPSRSATILPRFAALGAVTAALFLVFICAALIAKPMWSWRQGRGLASGQGIGNAQGGNGDNVDLCASGEASNSPLLEHSSYTVMPSQQASDELYLAQPVERSASKQADVSQPGGKSARGRRGASKGKRPTRRKKPKKHASQEGERREGREGGFFEVEPSGTLGSYAHQFSEARQLSFWLSSIVGNNPLEKTSTGDLVTPLVSSDSLSSGATNEAVGGLGAGTTQAGILASPPLDINLENLVDDDEDIVVGSWFPSPIKDDRPGSHFDAELYLADCDDLKCYQHIINEPTASSAEAGLPQTRLQDGSLTKAGAVQPATDTGAVVAASGARIDLEQHPFFRIPVVPPGLSAKQLDLAKPDAPPEIKKPVFVLESIRQIYSKPFLTEADLSCLAALVERLSAFALNRMCISLSNLFPHRYIDIIGTVFIVVDTLYCAIQLLGQNASSHQWWPHLMERIKISLSSFNKEPTKRRMRPRERKLAAALVAAIDTYTRGCRPSAKTVVLLKRSLFCKPGRTRFLGEMWDGWRREEAKWSKCTAC